VVVCGRSIPPAVLSYGSIMHLQFSTDNTISARGFIATLSFINEKGESQHLADIENTHCRCLNVMQPNLVQTCVACANSTPQYKHTSYYLKRSTVKLNCFAIYAFKQKVYYIIYKAIIYDI